MDTWGIGAAAGGFAATFVAGMLVAWIKFQRSNQDMRERNYSLVKQIQDDAVGSWVVSHRDLDQKVAELEVRVTVLEKIP